MSRHEPPDLPPDVIERALGGDADAFRRFYRRYDPTVRWAVGVRVYRWPTLVPMLDDIVQEVWLELMRSNGKRLRYHDAARGLPFHRFLALVCTQYGWRVAKRELRHPCGELEAGMDSDDWGFLMKLMHADFLEQLVQAVERSLSETDRKIFEGYYVQGEKLKVVGERLGMSENATCKRNERLQKKLRALAEDLLGQKARGTSPELVAMVLGVAVTLVRAGMGAVA